MPVWVRIGTQLQPHRKGLTKGLVILSDRACSASDSKDLRLLLGFVGQKSARRAGKNLLRLLLPLQRLLQTFLRARVVRVAGQHFAEDAHRVRIIAAATRLLAQAHIA